MILTWGYGNRSTDDLRRIIEERGVDLVADVRRSRKTGNPGMRPWRLKTIPQYEWFPVLGNTEGAGGTWQPESEQDAHRGLQDLCKRIERGETVLLMCGEADHTRCHRADVARQLAAMVTGHEIVHV